MVIRSEFSGVKAGDHVYGILREFLNYCLSPIFNILMFVYTYTPGSVPKLLHQEQLGPP